jgi:phage terminase large subunit-like protein
MSVDQIRQAAERDLVAFIKLIAPHRVLASFHEEMISWWTRSEAKSHQLVLVPRDHAKSAMLAYRVAWEITKNPAVRVLYISSTANLAEKQLKSIKDILTSDKYRRYWPEMVHPEEGKREKWTASEISVDHPVRAKEGIRDPTVFTGGLTTSLTGLHCDIACLDDVVVQENAYTEEGREKVRLQYSLLASIEAADAREWVVGTRYHPADLYNDLMEMVQDTFGEDGNPGEGVEVYEVFWRQVEDKGDGNGQFLWPRQQRADGKWFGFNAAILSKKKAQYLDKTQFYSQYYNDPNKYENSLIDPEKFQYFERSHLVQSNGYWLLRGKRLNVFAGCDLAFSETKRSDFTVIVVVGLDSDGFIYVLDIDRFKTEKPSEMFEHIRDSHIKWGYKKIRIEVVAAQKAIVREIKDQYIRPFGLSLSIEDHNPTRHDGIKEERILQCLQPRYENKSIWHYRGGNCQILEDELKMRHPPHDDIKDALTIAIDGSVAPRERRRDRSSDMQYFNSRFGGVAI